MRSITRRGLASALSLILLSGLTVAAAAPPATAARLIMESDRFFVVNNNIENRSCVYKWVRLLAELDDNYAHLPDILTLQQVAGKSDLEIVKKKLSSKWNVEYDGVLSRPKTEGAATNACASSKGAQSNAVLWRTDRFKKVGTEVIWDSDGQIRKDSTESWSSCKDLVSHPDLQNQKRARNVAVALTDRKRANSNVVVASVHWPLEPREFLMMESEVPPVEYQAHACAKKNMNEADAALDALIRDTAGLKPKNTVKIIGGDMNANTSVDGWWNRATRTAANGGLGYADPIADLPGCNQTDGSQFKKCRGSAKSGVRNSGHRTTALNRIDYILIKNAESNNNASTVAQPTSGKLYSNHRAVRAPVFYKHSPM